MRRWGHGGTNLPLILASSQHLINKSRVREYLWLWARKSKKTVLKNRVCRSDSPGHLQRVVGKQKCWGMWSALAAPCQASARVASNLEVVRSVRTRGLRCRQEREDGGCRVPAWRLTTCRVELFPIQHLPRAQRWEGALLMTWCLPWPHPGTVGPPCPLHVYERRQGSSWLTGGRIFSSHFSDRKEHKFCGCFPFGLKYLQSNLNMLYLGCKLGFGNWGFFSCILL